MSRSLHIPSVRQRDGGWWRKMLPLLVGAVVLALIWAERRSSKRENGAIGTAPAGAPPMREREPAPPSFRTNPLLERPAPYATPGTTSGAMAGTGGAAAGPAAARQPAPIAEADAPGTAAPEQLAEAGPDLAAWVSDLVSDTGVAEATEGAGVPAGRDAGSEVQSRAEGDVAGESGSGGIPTPAAAATAITADEGVGWIQVDGTRTCPPEFPIKGNASSRIYHLPGESTYQATIPEICFATEAAAVALGYRARKR